jgi:hypothetical protein
LAIPSPAAGSAAKPIMTPTETMQQIDTQLAHVWMVRTFLKHSDEAQEDDEVAEVHRELYDYMLALGGPYKAGDADDYLRTARKKLAKLKRATALFTDIQPEVSSHTNFQMAAASLRAAVSQIEQLLAAP